MLGGLFWILLYGAASSAQAEDELDKITAPDLQVEPKLRREEALEEMNFFRYRDNYFLAGSPTSKIQLSLRLRPVLRFNLYLAYTQIVFWKTASESRPFEDITFNPEIFYEWIRPERLLHGVKLGLEHRSNGQASTESRSMDRVFAELDAELGWHGLRILCDTRMFWIYDIDWQTNTDIKEYAGFWFTRITIDGLFEQLIPSKAELYVQLYPGGASGTKIRYGAIETGLKLRARLFHIMPYLMFQYYYGYMESMLNYNQLTHSYRIGFLL